MISLFILYPNLYDRGDLQQDYNNLKDYFTKGHPFEHIFILTQKQNLPHFLLPKSWFLSLHSRPLPNCATRTHLFLKLPLKRECYCCLCILKLFIILKTPSYYLSDNRHKFNACLILPFGQMNTCFITLHLINTFGKDASQKPMLIFL